MFLDRIKITLKLTIGSQTFTVVGGDLKRFELLLEPWGFRGSASWYFVCVAAQSEDTLFAQFVGTALIAVELTLSRNFDEVSEQSAPVTLKGLVRSRHVTERTFPDVAGQPVLQRRYEIEFSDRAFALWSQHRPLNLYVDKSHKDLIEDNKPDGVTIKYDQWAAATKTFPVLSLGLGASLNDATFYDFLFWLLHRDNKGLYYDIATNTYSIVDAKPSAAAAEELRRVEVESLEAYFPTVPRDAVNVLNAYSEAATKTKAITNAQAVTGVRTDYLIRSPIAADINTRGQLETARAAARQPEAIARLLSYPAVQLMPSMKVKLDTDWGTNVYQANKTYRVVSTHITAEADSQEPTDDNGEASNRYKLEYVLRLELDGDAAFRYPPFVRPVWPFHVEGKVLSETGQTTEGTYQSYTEQATSLDRYKVKIPLWADKQVIVPYDPGAMPGHFYFPLDRDARVLVALSFDHAEICAVLDWRTGARLPLETQGNHLLLGKGAKDQTSIQHVYTDAKPVLTVKRTKESDLQTITISEGVIRLETKDTA